MTGADSQIISHMVSGDSCIAKASSENGQGRHGIGMVKELRKHVTILEGEIAASGQPADDVC